MRVFLDERPLGVEPADLSEALRAGVEQAERLGRMVVGVSGDGRALSDDLLADPAGSTERFDEVRLVSADPRELVLGALDDAQTLLLHARSGQGDAASAFMIGQIEAGAEHLRGVVSAWRTVRDTLARLGPAIGADLNVLAFDSGDGSERTVGGEAAALAKTLEQLLGAVGRADWSCAADILDYELAAAADTWAAMLRRVAAFVREGR